MPPVTVNDAVTTPNGTSVSIPVTANDSDSDGTLDCATIDLDVTTAGIQTTATVTGGTFTVNGCNVDFVPNGTFTGQACVDYTINDNTGATSNVSSICVTVSAPILTSSVSIDKSVNIVNPNVGTNVTFTVAVSNAGPAVATGVVVTDVLPSGYSLDNVTTSAGNFNSTTGIWTIGTIAVGTTEYILMEVVVNGSGNYLNTATVTSSNDPTGAHSDTASTSPIFPPVVNDNPSMKVTKQAVSVFVKDTINFEQVLFEVNYKITATNTGNTVLNNVQVTDNLSSTFAGVDTLWISGTPTATGGLFANNTSFNGKSDINLLVSSLSNLAIGETATIEFSVSFTSKSLETYTNIAKGTATYNGVSVSDTGSAALITPDVKLDIPQAFTPNGDGKNEAFIIKGIEKYPNNTILIFNRWGNKVYEKAGYLNEWAGENTNDFSAGRGTLPEGTYFYTIDLGDGSPIIKGYVYLKR